jgi:hypothetical protein
MIPMTDILGDIKEQFGAVDVILANFSDVTQSEYIPDQSDHLNAHRVQADAVSASSGHHRDLGSPSTSPRGDPQAEGDDSRVAASGTWQQRENEGRKMKPTAAAISSAKCQSCGLTEHHGPCANVLSRVAYSVKHREALYRWTCHECGGDNSYVHSPRCTNGFCGHGVTGCPYCTIYMIKV